MGLTKLLTKEITFVNENNTAVGIPWLYTTKRERIVYEANTLAELGRHLIRYIKELDFSIVPQDTECPNSTYLSFDCQYYYSQQCYNIKFDFVYKYKYEHESDPVVSFDDFVEYVQYKVLKIGSVNEKIESSIRFYYDLIDLQVFINDLQVTF